MGCRRRERARGGGERAETVGRDEVAVRPDVGRRDDTGESEDEGDGVERAVLLRERVVDEEAIAGDGAMVRIDHVVVRERESDLDNGRRPSRASARWGCAISNASMLATYNSKEMSTS